MALGVTSDVRMAVLMGGPSAEHDISLKSGQSVVAALTRRGWQVEPLTIPRTLSVEEATDAVPDMLRQAHPEVVFVALHGPFGEDGTIQQVCDALHLPYTGSGPEASRLGMDKVASRRRFEHAGLTVPQWRLLDAASLPARAELCEAGGPDPGHLLGDFTLPVIVKPTNQGSSIGVTKVERDEELPPAIENAARYDQRVLMEEWIDGREVTVGILGEEALPVVEIQSSRALFDYTAKYTPGQTRYLVPAPLPEEWSARIQTAGLHAHHALGCRHFSRVDMMLTAAGEPVILEVNTIPGLTTMSLLPKAAAHAGISYDALCERMVMLALETVESVS